MVTARRKTTFTRHRKKTIEELAREQGVPIEPRPDYRAVASKVWRSSREVAEFERFARSLRHRSSSS